jgi:putative peptide zinc metalloprotease protein
VMSTVSVETTPAPAEYGERSSPCLAEGTELFGEYEGSAYQNAQYLVRRHDGQVIQLTRLLYLVASFLDGNRRLAEVAERVTAGFGRHVVADNVVYLVNNKLQPLGLVANTAEANTATLTRSTRCRRMIGSTARVTFMGPSRLVASCCSTCSAS